MLLIAKNGQSSYRIVIPKDAEIGDRNEIKLIARKGQVEKND